MEIYKYSLIPCLNRGIKMADNTETEEIDGGEAVLSSQNRVTIRPVPMALLKLRKGDRVRQFIRGKDLIIRKISESAPTGE